MLKNIKKNYLKIKDSLTLNNLKSPFFKKKDGFLPSFFYFGGGDGTLLRLRYTIFASLIYALRFSPETPYGKKKKAPFWYFFLFGASDGGFPC